MLLAAEKRGISACYWAPELGPINYWRSLQPPYVDRGNCIVICFDNNLLLLPRWLMMVRPSTQQTMKSQLPGESIWHWWLHGNGGSVLPAAILHSTMPCSTRHCELLANRSYCKLVWCGYGCICICNSNYTVHKSPAPRGRLSEISDSRPHPWLVLSQYNIINSALEPLNPWPDNGLPIITYN